MRRLRTAIFRFLVVATFVAVGAPAFAGETLEEAARAEFANESTGPGALSQAGATPTELLVAERLPDGSWGVEFGFELDGKRGRMPMRLREIEGRWSIVWSPVPSYGAALANMLKSSALPQSDSTRQWVKLHRMPALPVIVTSMRVITPFGVIEKKTSDSDPRGEPGGFRRPAAESGGPLPTSRALAAHAEKWIKEMLADDPAPAGFDLIVDASITWERFNAALFSIAGVGLYLGEVVAASQNALVSIPFAAPISAATGAKPPEMVLALYPTDDGWGMRIVLDQKPLPTGPGCPEPMAICPETPTGMTSDVTAIIGKRKIPRAMFASPGTTTTADALSWIEATQSTLRLGDHHLFLGFITP